MTARVEEMMSLVVLIGVALIVLVVIGALSPLTALALVLVALAVGYIFTRR